LEKKVRVLSKLTAAILTSIVFMHVNAETIIAGAGTLSCGEYVKYRRDSDELYVAVATWAQGYLTSINVQSGENPIIDIPEFETLSLLLENQCIKNPTFKIWMVTELITREYKKNIRKK
jgi:hypothetical protein